MIKLYYALLYPHLIYCIEIWGHGYVSNLKGIYLIQKNILKIIFNKPNDFSTVSLFKENKILSLYDICKYKTCIYMYKIFNTLCHPIILNHFTLTSKKRCNTRSNCDFIQPYFKYNYMNNTLITFGPRLWNDLSIDIRKSNSLSLFYTNLKIILYNT